ncbi:prenylcysteine oxidase-like [Linepithema humile]|uniref:prenylcysteine oxidase-like n=1 Tax=Linepithema humile TaxID=83485 RepID=UPI0006232E47|nr:PREDICTED: prenylcysteine oxidase-like [Linepithema humile]
MKLHIALFLLGILIHTNGISLDTPLPRIAIVGGGNGGASASHFLTELLNGNLEIDLYEVKTIGGRLATIKIGDDEFEAGGAIIHPKNMYMQKFVKLLGLEHNSPDGLKMGIWNGDEFVFKESDWSIVTIAQLLYRYGFQLFKLNRYVNDILDDFLKIYDLQDAGMSFANVTALLSALNKDFPKLLQTPIKDHLLHMGFTNQLIDELVQAVNVVNYGQEINIQSFVSLVSLAGASGELWSVKNGNKEVPQHLIYRNKNVNVVPSRVTKIRYVADNDKNQYEVTYINKDSTDPMTSNYDIVIIATPLTHDQAFPIEFVGFPDDFIFQGNYQTTYATFVKGNLNPKYFGLKETIDAIFSCNPNKTIISSIGQQGLVNGLVKKNSPVWKIFSRKSIDTNLIDKMFSKVTEKKEILWKAYPQYSTNLQLNKFKLHDALYHVNAIEWAASAMEMSAIAGRNVAILASDDFLQKYKPISTKAYKDSTKKLRTNEL